MLKMPTEFVRMKDGVIGVLFSDNVEEKTVHIVPQDQWENEFGYVDPEWIVCKMYNYTDIAARGSQLQEVAEKFPAWKNKMRVLFRNYGATLNYSTTTSKFSVELNLLLLAGRHAEAVSSGNHEEPEDAVNAAVEKLNEIGGQRVIFCKDGARNRGFISMRKDSLNINIPKYEAF